MLQAMNTGHDGSLTTVHANSPEDAITRLGTLASMSDVAVPYDALRDQINSAIDVMVHLERAAGGKRRIREVAVVASKRRESFRLATLMRWEDDGVGTDGRFVHFPLPANVARRLRAVPPEFTEAAADADHVPVREAT